MWMVILSPRVTVWVTDSSLVGLGDCAEMGVGARVAKRSRAIAPIVKSSEVVRFLVVALGGIVVRCLLWRVVLVGVYGYACGLRKDFILVAVD